MPVTEYAEAKVRINFKTSGGLTENLQFNTAIIADAKALCLAYCNYRAAILPKDFEIVAAVVSLKTKKFDRYPVTGFATKGILLAAEMTDPDPCNVPQDGLLYRFDTMAGKATNRLLRLVRDSWITNKQAMFGSTYLAAPFVPGAVPVATEGYTVALDKWVKWVGANTVFHKLTAPNTWDVLPFQRIQFLRVSTRDFGKGYSMTRGRKKATV